MTNEEIRQEVLSYRGAPFLCGEFATDLGITWHRMKRILNKMLAAEEVTIVDMPLNTYWVFYQVIRNG